MAMGQTLIDGFLFGLGFGVAYLVVESALFTIKRHFKL